MARELLVARTSQIRQRTSASRRSAASVPSSRTCAAAVRPSAHRVSSAGLPVTVTTGVRALAVIRTRAPAGSGPTSSRTSSTPTGALRSTNRAMLSRCQSASDSAGVTLRSGQSGVPAADVLVMHEELDQVGPLVHAGQAERGQPGRPVADGRDQAAE